MATIWTAFLLVLSAHAQRHESDMVLKFANGAANAHVIWIQGPQTPAESKQKIEWRDGASQARIEPPGTFKVVPYMPDMGHGTAPTRIDQATEQGQPLLGTYIVSKIYFTMGGKWEVNVLVQYPDGREETQTLKVDLGSHHH